MKAFRRLGVAALVALAGVALDAGMVEAQAATAGRIVFIDSQRLVSGAPGAAEAQQTLEREIGSAREEVQRMEATLDSLSTSYDQRQVMLSPEARRQLQEEIRGRQREFQARAMQLEQQAAQRQAELLQPIMTRIQQVIDQLRQERDYALVLDAAEGGVLAADPALDITDDVLSRLRSPAQGPAGQ